MREVFSARKGPGYLAEVDQARTSAIGESVVEYDQRSPWLRWYDRRFNPTVTEVSPGRDSKVGSVVDQVAATLRPFGAVLFALNVAVAANAYRETAQLDDRIIAAVAESGLPDIDQEFTGMNLPEATVHMMQPGQADRVENAVADIDRKAANAAVDAEKSAGLLLDASLGVAAFSLFRLGKRQFRRMQSKRGAKDTYLLRHHGRPLDIEQPDGATALTAPTPRGHTTRLSDDDQSPVLQLRTPVLSSGDIIDRFAVRYSQLFARFMIGGFALLNPLTLGAAERVDDVLDRFVPQQVQEGTTGLGRIVVDYEQQRIEASVERALEEDVLPETTRLSGGDLGPVVGVAGDQLSNDLDRHLDELAQLDVEYRPVSGYLGAVARMYGTVLGEPYERESGVFQIYSLATLCSLGATAIGRMMKGSPIFHNPKLPAYVSRAVVENAIDSSRDNRGNERPKRANPIKRLIKRRREQREAAQATYDEFMERFRKTYSSELVDF